MKDIYVNDTGVELADGIERGRKWTHKYVRHPISQELIDDILSNELKEFHFPVKPLYNPYMKDYGRTTAAFFPWGELKHITSIEIGKQGEHDREFLIDTLLHEYFEVVFFEKKYNDEFFKALDIAGDAAIHKWIDERINEVFRRKEW